MSARPEPRPVPAVTRQLLESARYEVIPMKSVAAAIPSLPAGCSVSVTCSPVKGIDATLELTSHLTDLGHHAVPHLSARLVEDHAHVKRLAAWCRSHGLTEAFVIAGDATQPAGSYPDVASFLREFLDEDPGLTAVGVAAYPDGHALIDRRLLHEALHEKQALFEAAGVNGYASTQMCFDAEQWRSWAEFERHAGLRLPLHLGVPGPIDRTKLLTMGMRLGIGASMRYVKKNRGALGRLFSPAGYDPTKMLGQMVRVADQLGIVGLHVFTFNNVESTAAWQRRQLAKVG
jgi:methylenetetrahydrofolate reductase (NADPH)